MFQQKKYSCSHPGCDKKFSNLSYLRRHFKSSHETASKLFVCCEEKCGKKYRSEHSLKAHVEVAHLGQRPHSCTICDKSFIHKFRLKDHMAEHTGEYRFKCEICQKGFNHLLKFNRHKQTHNKKKCEICEKEFEKWTDLVAHKRTDHQKTEFKCEICDKSFCTNFKLKIHTEIHRSKDESEVFQCEYENCPKFYFHKRNMDAHIRSKHKGKKFPCTIEGCETSLVTKQKLDLHIKWHETSKDDSPKVVKVKKVRAKRKDAGDSKISTASILSGVQIPLDVEKMLKNDQGDEIEVDPEHMEVDISGIQQESEDEVQIQEQPVGLNFIDPTVVIPKEVKQKWFQENKHLLIETK